MKGSEKMLVVFVGAIFLLVIVAVGLVMLRPEQEYVAMDTPQGTVQNYLLALQRQDYEHAYECLDDSVNVDDLEDFTDSIRTYRWRFDLDDNVALSIKETKMINDSTAQVSVDKTSTYNDLFGGGSYASTFDVSLKNRGGVWKIVDSADYWHWCWDRDSECS